MYIIDYCSTYFYITFKDIEFVDAVEFLKSIKIYYDKTVRKTVIKEDKIMDAIALLDFYTEEYVLTEIALNRLKDIINSIQPEQQYFRRPTFDKSILQPNFTLKEYQEDCLNFTLSRSRGYIADDAGIGKCLSADHIVEIKVNFIIFLLIKLYLLIKKLLKV